MDTARFAPEEGGGDWGDGSHFDPSLFTKTLQSTVFGMKVELALKLHECAQALSDCAESCPCHGELLRRMTRRKRERFMRTFTNLPGHIVCPFAGKRAPELAAGKLTDVFQSISEAAFHEVLLTPASSPATPAEFAELRTVFAHCSNHLYLFLKLQLDFWSKPPYIVCGMAHWDPIIARRCAREGLAAFNEHPVQAAQHRVTWRICHLFWTDLQDFINGAPLSRLSAGFQRQVATLLLVPVTERSVEAKHALVKMALFDSGLKGSTVKISFANRLPELRARIQREPEVVQRLLHWFAQARHHARVAPRLGREHHPLLVGLHRAHPTKYTATLRAVIYRADAWSQSISFIAQHQENQRLRGAASREEVRAVVGAGGGWSKTPSTRIVAFPLYVCLHFMQGCKSHKCSEP